MEKKATMWAFGAKWSEIDVPRCLREAPATCSVVRIVIGDSVMIAIRRNVFEQIRAIGIPMDLPGKSAGSCFPVVGQDARFAQCGNWAKGDGSEKWVFFLPSTDKFDEICNAIDALRRHNEQRRVVEVTAY